MLAHAPRTADELDAGPRKGGPGTERLCAVTRDGEADRRADPLRGRAGRRRARSQAQAAGPRHCGSRRRGRRSRTPSRARFSPAASSATSASTPELADQTERPAGALGARCARHRRQGRAGRRPASPRSRRRLARDRIVGAAARVGRRRRRRCASSPARCGGGTMPSESPSITGFHDGPIGFGIGPVKCGTCSPACRACE